MATRHSHEHAVRLAGDLYGKILNRNADKGGFEYVLDSLQAGRKSVRQHALEMVLSDEFKNQFLRGRNEASAVMLLNRVLLGRTLTRDRVHVDAIEYRQVGLDAYAERLTRSDEFRKNYGDDRVPGLGH